MRHVTLAVRLACIALGTISFSACAATMGVGSHVQTGLEMSQYKTYEWGPADALPTGDPRLDKDPLFRDHIEGAVEKQLAGKGLIRATSAPDLLLHYHASIDTRIDVGRTEREYGYCRTAECKSWVVDYEAGTVVLDVVDARTNQLIWRGWAQDSAAPMLSDSDRLREKVKEAVGRMMASFPRP